MFEMKTRSNEKFVFEEKKEDSEIFVILVNDLTLNEYNDRGKERFTRKIPMERFHKPLSNWCKWIYMVIYSYYLVNLKVNKSLMTWLVSYNIESNDLNRVFWEDKSKLLLSEA